MTASLPRTLAALWGVAGFTALLGAALHRLVPYAIEALQGRLTVLQTTILVLNTLFMIYSEGYRGFQKRYSPRFAARVVFIRDRANTVEALLAPLYCMGFFGASRRQMITTWALTLVIIGLVILFRYIPQPWRGVLDLGVVAGLAYGLVASWALTVRGWRQPQHAARPNSDRGTECNENPC